MNKFVIVLFHLLLICSCTKTVEFGQASATWSKNKLTVTTGVFTRSWNIESYGLVTKSIIDLPEGKEWCNDNKNSLCDWDYQDMINPKTKGKILSIKAKKSDDSGFTSDHLSVIVEYEYPEISLEAMYEIRAYPGAPGIYTNLSLKGNPIFIQDNYKTKEIGIRFALHSGKNIQDYKSSALVPEYIASHAYSTECVEYAISGLNEDQKYIVGVSWWQNTGSDVYQDLYISSLDGETEIKLSENHHIPTYPDNKAAEEQLFVVPAQIVSGGSFRLYAKNISGGARISEIWIYEETDMDNGINGDPDRISALNKLCKEPGFKISGYINCGHTEDTGADKATGRVDYIPMNAAQMTREYIGYYNDTQHRNKQETPLLKEDIVDCHINNVERNSWASILIINDNEHSLSIVKESHKCVNQFGHDTGEFILDKHGISNTGTALKPDEILPDKYRKTWATWTISSKSNTFDKEMAIKKFERMRYPVNHDTDVYIIANVWGSGRGAAATYEANILKELEIQNQLGIDVQQIDDGYFYPGLKRPLPQNSSYMPHESKYPEGFVNVKKKAEDFGMKLGLWFPAMHVSLEDMKNNYHEGGFKYIKLDFTDFQDYNQIEDMLQKIRKFELYTGHTARVNWDVTENAPRFGYFWAKEYGCVFLENRKHDKPANVIYVPYLVLRDLWHLSKYCNLNKFQGTIQNKDMVDKNLSDAYMHTQEYTVAIAIMSTPLFFMETQFYSEDDKEKIKFLLDSYKKIRHDLYDCIIFPIGEEPDNTSWTGFQAIYPDGNKGYVTIFRELGNHSSLYSMRLNDVANSTIKFTDLLTGAQAIKTTEADGSIEFEITESGNFKLMSYQIL